MGNQIKEISSTLKRNQKELERAKLAMIEQEKLLKRKEKERKILEAKAKKVLAMETNATPEEAETKPAPATQQKAKKKTSQSTQEQYLPKIDVEQTLKTANQLKAKLQVKREKVNKLS